MRKLVLFIIYISFAASSKSQYIDSNLNLLTSNVRKPSIIIDSFWENAWIDYTKKYYKYSNGNVAEQLIIDQVGDTLSRTKYTYDSIGRRSIVIVEELDIWDMILKPSERYTYIYYSQNSKSYKIREREKFDDIDSTWKYRNRETNIYNEKNHLLESISENYISNTWVINNSGYRKYNYVYLNPISTLITEKTDSINLNNFFIPITKQSYEYNNNNVMYKRSEFQYSNVWDTTLVEFVDYDTFGIPSSMSSFSKIDQQKYLTENLRLDSFVWDNFNINKSFFEQSPISHSSKQRINNQFNYVYKFTVNKLDTFGSKITTRFDYNNSWILSLKDVYLYDHKKNITLSERFDYINNNWVKMPGYCYEYYNTYNSDDLIMVITKVYDELLNSYVNSHKTEYIDYISTNINTTIRTFNARLYPNPSSNGSVNINIDLEAASALSIKVSDMKGSVVYTDERNVGKGLNTIELKNLKQGMYVVELTTEFGVSRTKLIVNGEL